MGAELEVEGSLSGNEALGSPGREDEVARCGQQPCARTPVPNNDATLSGSHQQSPGGGSEER